MAQEESSRNASSSPQGPVQSWNRPLVLSLDGGGVRGLSTLLILKAIFTEVASLDKEEQHDHIGHSKVARPCNYLDHIVGTSTGGLIALLLGRLRLPIQKAIELYIEFAGRVFGKPQRLAKLSLFGFRLVAYKYSAKHFEEVIKDALKKNCGEKADEFELMQDGGDPDIRRCMTSVVAFQHRGSMVDIIRVFRVYDHIPKIKSNGDVLTAGLARDTNPFIWQVARATSAAPGYFEPMVIGNDPYLDGGLRANNPAVLAYDNARQVVDTKDARVDTLISVGTGKQAEKTAYGGRRRLVKYLSSQVTNTENADHFMARIVSEQVKGNKGPATRYYRFNVTNRLQDTKLDEWTTKGRLERINNIPQEIACFSRDNVAVSIPGESLTLAKIEDATRAYLQSLQASEIQNCARELFDRAQKRRQADLNRWQHFTKN